MGVLGGGGIRFTGHLDDAFFLEATLGGMGRAYDDARTLYEVPFLFGLRIMAPIITPIFRMYGTLATGIALRGVGGEGAGTAWGVFPVELGGGVEMGGPLDERFSIGGFLDVRAAARVPFEREEASLGLAWSAGLAFLWF